MRSEGKGGPGHPVVIRVVLYEGLPCVDVELTLVNKPADPWPEAGWLCFPFTIKEPRFRVGRQGSIVDPVSEFVRGANRHLFGVNSGVAIFDAAGGGVGLCARDSMLMSFDVPGVMKYSRDFVPKRPAVYVNLFNNHWTTNFRMWNEGTWTSRVRLWSFEAFEPESCLIAPAWETRLPLWEILWDGRAGTRPAGQTGLCLSEGGVLVNAFVANPDGAGTLLRIWEQVGRTGPCRVTLPVGSRASSAQPCDLRGRPIGQPMAIHSGEFDTKLDAYAPASFIMQ